MSMLFSDDSTTCSCQHKPQLMGVVLIWDGYGHQVYMDSASVESLQRECRDLRKEIGHLRRQQEYHKDCPRSPELQQTIDLLQGE